MTTEKQKQTVTSLALCVKWSQRDFVPDTIGEFLGEWKCALKERFPLCEATELTVAPHVQLLSKTEKGK